MSIIHDESRIRGVWITKTMFAFGGVGMLLTDSPSPLTSMKYFSILFFLCGCVVVVLVTGDEAPRESEFLLA